MGSFHNFWNAPTFTLIVMFLGVHFVPFLCFFSLVNELLGSESQKVFHFLFPIVLVLPNCWLVKSNHVKFFFFNQIPKILGMLKCIPNSYIRKEFLCFL
jgi:hypothetical protein